MALETGVGGGCFGVGARSAMIDDLVAFFALDSLSDAAARRSTRKRMVRLQREGKLLCSIHAVDGDLGRFGDMWLSSEWNVAPGRIHVGSTSILVTGVGAGRPGEPSGKFLLPAGLDAVVLPLVGPGPQVEIAMAAESEEWFRGAVAR